MITCTLSEMKEKINTLRKMEEEIANLNRKYNKLKDEIIQNSYWLAGYTEELIIEKLEKRV